MSSLTQAGRPLVLSTPLGEDAMLAVALNGTEGISKLFSLTVDAVTPRASTVAFDKLLGQPVGLKLTLSKSGARHFHGLCVRLAQGNSDALFTNYRLEIVPSLWLLTKRTQSRIFQQLTVPEILKKVFTGLTAEYNLAGKFEPRDYVVQYRETDFAFASRLMEEEGIFYFFKFGDGSHTLVVANNALSHPTVVINPTVVYRSNTDQSEGGDIVTGWTKVQEQSSGKFLLWDHTFEMPHRHHESAKPLTETATVGAVAHKLGVGDHAKLEVYDWPGAYAQRFDGIDPNGGEQAGELAKIGDDGKRTVELRMQAAAAAAVTLNGEGRVRQMAAGHKFTLATLPTDLVTTPIKPDGDYVLTAVQHFAELPANYRSGSGGFVYRNSFTAIPAALPYRPQRTTEKPVVPGSQTAVVVGPPGEEIFTDKYGRIKVQFHWDREGKNNAASSCWIRVAHFAAGRDWGMVSIPRVGQEVLIDFLEGDPDQPLCVGCVYNPDQMPPYKLPDEKTKTVLRTNSSPGGDGYNAIRIEDKAGSEQIYTHAQKDMDTRVRSDLMERVGKDHHLRVGFYLANDHKGVVSGETKKGHQYEEIAIDHHRKVHRNSDEHVGGDLKLLVGGIDGPGNVDIHIKKTKQELIDDTSDLVVKKAVTETFDATHDFTVKGAVSRSFQATVDETVDGAVVTKIGGNADHDIGGDRTEAVGGKADLKVGTDLAQDVGASVSLTVGTQFDLKAGTSYGVNAGTSVTLIAGTTLVLEAMTITLKGAGGFVTISPAGVAISGTLVMINSGGAAVPGTPPMPKKPKAPKAAKAAKAAKNAADAKPTKPKDADHSKTGRKSN